jgi:CRP/FNR family transcriptional regulator
VRNNMSTMESYLRHTRAPVVVGVSNPCKDCEARAYSLCRSLPEADLAQLARVTRRINLEAGRVLLSEGEPVDHYFNIVEGNVRVFRTLEDGRRQITGFLERGDFIGLALGETHDFTVEAIDDVELCQFPRRALLALVDDLRPLERALRDLTSHELVAAHDHMVLLGRKTAKERVASFLMQRACPAPTGMPESVRLPMTQTDIADYLGLRLETVSRVMNALRSQGVIARPNPHHVLVMKPDTLRQAAG